MYKGSDHGDAASHALVEAFAKFILPKVKEAHWSNTDSKNLGITSDSGTLIPEAQQLITSLNNFVSALARSNAKPSEHALIKHEKKLPTNNKKSHLLQLTLDTMYQRIYNYMPIRLLSFDAKGTGIRLVERGEIWQKLSGAIEGEFNEEIIEASIRTIEKETLSSDNSSTKTSESPEKLAIRGFLARYGQYAILSHTWLQSTLGEVTYDAWQNGTATVDSPGYRKLANFCRIAATEYGITLGWMDTICIDKASSSELDESIRSMSKWYRSSYRCITYLSNTTNMQDMGKDAWFTRGWTLQELIAPMNIKFYNKEWNQLAPGVANDKTYDPILQVIQEAGGITKEELTGQLWTIPISRRMQWAASRQVTRAEDIAYSLMGIFGVSMSTAYGEGPEQAFFRLVQGILNTNTLNLLDIMNWGYGDEFPKPRTIDHTSMLIPAGPKQYTWRSRDINWFRPNKPITLTHLGLHLPVLLMPGIPTDAHISKGSHPIGHYYATATDVDLLYPNNDTSRQNYALLHRSIYEHNGHTKRMITFGVMNFSESGTDIILPLKGECFAVPFQISPQPVRGTISEEISASRIAIKRAIIFDLKGLDAPLTRVAKNDLQRHGITLRTMYL